MDEGKNRMGSFGTLGGSRLNQVILHWLRSSERAHITENVIFPSKSFGTLGGSRLSKTKPLLSVMGACSKLGKPGKSAAT